MDHYEQFDSASSEEETFQTWEDMREEVWHELQEGGEVSDALVDSYGNIAVLISSWRFRQRMWGGLYRGV